MNKKVLLLGSIIASLAYGETEIKLGSTTVVSTTGFATDVRKVVATPTVITAEEIQENGYTTVLEALKDVPAINVMANGFGSMIDMRGQGGVSTSGGAKRNVQVLVDGIAVNSLETSMSSTPINTVSIDKVERIEVIPGSGAVLYGSGTAGGVVNIITKKGSGTRGSFGYDFTTLGGHKKNVSAGYTLGKLDIDLSYANNELGGYRTDSKNDSEYFMGTLRYDINDDHNVEFKYANYNEDTNLLDMLTQAQIDADRNQGDSNNLIDVVKTDKEDYSLTYNGKLSDNLEANIIAFKSETNMNIFMPQMYQVTPMGAMYMNMSSDFPDEKKGVKAKLKYSYGDESSIIFGADYIKNEGGRYMYMDQNMSPMMPSGLISSMDLNKDTIAGFVMNNYRTGNFEFNQGLRYEKADYSIVRGNIDKDYNEDNFAYELSGNYLYSDLGKTYVRYEKGFTSPPVGLMTNKWSDVYYDSNVETEKYNSIEWGLSDYIGNTSINMSMFYQRMDDEIHTNMTGMSDADVIYNYNIPKTERYGMEIQLKQYIDKWTFSQSYNYINAEIKEGIWKQLDENGVIHETGIDLAGNKIAGVAPHKLTLGAAYQVTDKFSIYGEAVYNDGYYISNLNEGNGKTSDYIVANLRFNYNADNGLNLHAGINNLFDEEYNNYASFDSDTGLYSYDPAAERNFYVGFNYSF